MKNFAIVALTLFIFVPQLSLAGFKAVGSLPFIQKGQKSLIIAGESNGQKLAVAFESESNHIVKQFKPSTLSMNFKANMVDQIKRFPMEAFTFFVAIGAINFAKVVFDESNNPVLMQQHLNAQGDPIAQISFLAFMMANGTVTQPLMGMAKSKKASAFIPYFGMTAGMMASNIVHELANSPNLLKCAVEVSSLRTEKKYCDMAFESWQEKGLETIHEWAPSLISMISSTMASGYVTQLTNKTILLIKGVEFGFNFTPTGWVVKIGKYVAHLTQISLFISLDEIFHKIVRFPYMNLVKFGPQLTELHNKITNTSSEKELIKLTKDFQKTISLWRQFNLENSLISHGSWITYLSEMSTTYNATKSFYGNVISEVITKSPQSPLIKSYPLNGIIPKNIENTSWKNEGYTLAPEAIEKLQLEKVKELVEKYNNEAKLSISRSIEKNELAYLNVIFEGLNSQNIERIVQSLNKLLSVQRDSYFSTHFKKITYSILRFLGGPQPVLKPGVGYAEQLLKTNSNSYISTLHVNIWKNLGPVFFDNPGQYLTYQMLAGADPMKTKLFRKNTNGFDAEFISPKIPFKSNFSLPVYNKNTPANGLKLAFENLSVRNLTNNKVYENPSLAIFDAELPEDIKEKGFDFWWTENIEPQFLDAWVNFESRYMAIVAKFFKELRSENSMFNRSEFSNNVIVSLGQERELYYKILSQQINRSDLEKIEDQFIQLESLLNGIAWNKNGYLKTSLSMSDFEQKSKQLEETLNQYAKSYKSNLSVEIFGFLNLQKDELSNYGKIALTGSYRLSQNGEFVRPRCLYNVQAYNIRGVMNDNCKE